MKLHTFVVGLTALVHLQTAQAVFVSPDGRGQALIYPYYTANGTNDTLFSIVNPPSSPAKAAKVRFFEGRNGRPVLEFNLYLATGRTWTAAITRDTTGKPVLRTFDPACTVPGIASSSVAGATEFAFSNVGYAGYDQAGSSLDRAKEGHFEVIEMGEIDTAFQLSAGKSLVQAITPPTRYGGAENQDCAAVTAAWNAGGAFISSGGAELTAPTGNLFGHALIINVSQGTEYSYDPVALGQLFAAKRHTGPGDAHPNLGDADPASFVVANGAARQSTWNMGIDAMSAVLTHKEILNEYVGPPTPTAPVSSDVIVSFPTKSFYVARESDSQTTRVPFISRFDNLVGNDGALLADGTSEGACEFISSLHYGRDGLANHPTIVFIIPTYPTELCWQTSVISAGNVLDSANAIFQMGNVDYTTSGTLHISLDNDTPFAESNGRPPLTSLEGHKYPGLPVAGFAVQRRINGDLDGVRANYGGTSMPKYETGLE